MHVAIGCGQWRLIGGSERYALEIAEALSARGHELTVLYGDGDPEPLAHTRFVRFEPLAAGVFEKGPERRGELAGILAGALPDVVLQLTPAPDWVVETFQLAAPYVRFVQDHTLFCPGLNKMLESGETCADALGSACVKQYLLGPGCVGMKPGPGPRNPAKPVARVMRKRRELELHDRAALLIVASEYMRDELVAARIDPARIAVLPYPTRAATGATPPVELPSDTRAFVEKNSGPLLLTPARLALPDKGIDYLITALGHLRRPFRAVVAGTGPAESWLHEQARTTRLAGDVHFAGWLDSDQLEALYPLADVVVVPSVWDEPFGLVGIEAMAHGTPVVAFEVGGVPEWLAQGIGGMLAPRKDTGAMARAIETLAWDADLARLVGAAGKRRVERQFRTERHVERLEVLLESARAVGDRRAVV